MALGLVTIGEQAGALEHDIDTELAPGQLGRIALGADADAVAIDHQRIAVDLDRAGEVAVGGVVAGQMGVGLGIAEIVDGDDLDLAIAPFLVQRAQHVAPDAAVTVDRCLDGHYLVVLLHVRTPPAAALAS